MVGEIVAARAAKKAWDKTSKTSTFSTSRQSDAEEKFKDSQYGDMVSSNPYENFEYQNGVWDRIGDMFGFRTGQDKYREDMALASGEYLSQIESLKREEDYNSESAKVARMKAAGLNPDLMGIDSASSASEFAEPEASPLSPDAMTGAQAAGLALDFGSSIVGGISTIGNLLLSLEHASLVNEGLSIDNAAGILDLINNGGATFDMPDIGSGEVVEGEEGVEGTPLPASRAESGRIETIAKALFGDKNSRAKRNFIASMRARQGTLSALTTHISGEVSAAVGQGDLNVAKATLAGRKSVSNAPIIEEAILRSTINDAMHNARLAEIEREFVEENADTIKQGMVNEAIEAAEYDPHLAAVAANAGSSADIADAGATIDEAKARKKEAALAEENARYAAENLKIVEDIHESWKNGNWFQRRKFKRQIRAAAGYAPYHEPEIPFSGSVNYSGSRSTRRSSSEVIRRNIK